MENYTVYKHISPSGKIYIGITKQTPKDRWGNGTGYGNRNRISRAIQKYGWDSFTHEILFENLTKEEACQKEIELIAEYKSNNPEFGYNITAGGEGFSGVKHSQATKDKISKTKTGKPSNKKDFSVSIETRQKISKTLKERGYTHPAWNKGIPMKEETKQKLREINTNPINRKIWIKKDNYCTMIYDYELDKYLQEGYKRGRIVNWEAWNKGLPMTKDAKENLSKMYKGTVWVTKENIHKQIKVEELETYISQGFHRGMK